MDGELVNPSGPKVEFNFSLIDVVRRTDSSRAAKGIQVNELRVTSTSHILLNSA